MDVVAFGENSVDLVARLAAWPDPGGKSAVVSLERRPGGQMATAAAACRRLGLRVTYVGAFGSDEDGEWLQAELRRQHVPVIAIARPCPSRRAVILVDDATGDRAVLEHRDARLNILPAQLPMAALSTACVLLVDATDVRASLALTREARRRGVPVMLDVDRPVAGLAPLLAAADIVSVAASFPRAYTGERRLRSALRRIADATGAALVVATLGAEGSAAWTAGQFVRTPAIRVRAVDTTGAGDVFRAGFLAAWIRSRGRATLHDVLKAANAAAGLSTRGPGAWGALPRWAEVRARL